MRPIRLTEDEEIIAEEEAKINSKFYMNDFCDFFSQENEYAYHKGLAYDQKNEWESFKKENDYINKKFYIENSNKEAYIQNCNLLENFHEYQIGISKSIIPRFIHKEVYNFFEFGCGICPVSYLILNFFNKQDRSSFLNLNICDFDCDHFHFGIWRLYNFLENNQDLDCSINDIYSEDNEFHIPSEKQDVIYLMNILNHLPDPLLAIRCFKESLSPEGLIVENFYRSSLSTPGHVSHRDDFFEKSMKDLGFKKYLTHPYEQRKKIVIWELA
jgi:SAM-dependent methyltransferase